jgi:hypothetical protein
MQIMQNKTFSIIQEIQKNVNEMYTDWKATGGFGSHAESDTKWIEASIFRNIYTLTKLYTN